MHARHQDMAPTDSQGPSAVNDDWRKCHELGQVGEQINEMKIVAAAPSITTFKT